MAPGDDLRYSLATDRERFLETALNERLYAAGLLPALNEAVERQDRSLIAEILSRVDASPALATVLLGEHFVCGFCERLIASSESDALQIALNNLWAESEIVPSQAFYAHFGCASEHMSGVAIKIEPAAFPPGPR
jgi:hypothetical protein